MVLHVVLSIAHDVVHAAVVLEQEIVIRVEIALQLVKPVIATDTIVVGPGCIYDVIATAAKGEGSRSLRTPKSIGERGADDVLDIDDGVARGMPRDIALVLRNTMTPPSASR